ncbi:hypothetical protein [Luteimonas mephitis]|jgi:hypothetical protein|uniref:hypothetical protein n=1 Tax=Luteimonas mephitis TaxID=83615 RepID=UPI0004261432|nr:hypothetical protein [Luteimonas mephitis]
MRTLLPHAAAVAGLLPLLFAACSTPPADASDQRAVADGETFTLATGERVALADRSTLRYVRVTNDSRCKPGRQCVWAGDAEVVFEWATDAAAKPESFSLHTGRGDRSKDLGGRRLTLVSLAQGAEPEAQLKLETLP